MSRDGHIGETERRLSARSRGARLGIPEHALAALEYQARRHYRRWWLEDAERIARMVIRFDVGRPVAWFILGDIEMRRMNWQRAFEYFQQAVDCRRLDALAWCRGAEALFRLGDYQRAEDWFDQAVEIGQAGDSPGARRARDFLRRHRKHFETSRAAPNVGETADSRRHTTPENVYALGKYRQDGA